ncbi:MAG: hypothetical protein IIA00_10175 [Proteobacteria bacterium]|nr:hypothetical protein [Pseudomonadota bacterium]
MSAKPFPVYVGWDSREDIAYQACRHSLLERATVPISVTPLKQDELSARGLCHRPPDPLASTEFTYTRFLVPHLAGHAGWALFCDCDFLWVKFDPEHFTTTGFDQLCGKLTNQSQPNHGDIFAERQRSLSDPLHCNCTECYE